MKQRRIRVLIADDHEVVREGLRMMLSEEPEVAVVGEAADGAEAVEKARSLRPDVVLMDVVMRDLNGIEATRRIRAAGGSTQVLMLSSFADDAKVREAVQAGAIGYLMKDVLRADLLKALRDAAGGTPTLHPEAQRHLMREVACPAEPSPLDGLTPRERDVLRHIREGRSNRAIAQALGLSEGTVKGHVSALLAKLHLADRTQLALFAVKHGLPQA